MSVCLDVCLSGEAIRIIPMLARKRSSLLKGSNDGGSFPWANFKREKFVFIFNYAYASISFTSFQAIKNIYIN